MAQEKLLTINSILLIDRKAFPKRICREGGQLIPLDFSLFYNPIGILMTSLVILTKLTTQEMRFAKIFL